jgi:hypothetical protein
LVAFFIKLPIDILIILMYNISTDGAHGTPDRQEDKMLGSQKQIKWAEDIRQGKLEDFAKLEARALNGIAHKAISYIRDNEQASFWIDYRTASAADMLRSLLTGGISVWGFNFDRKAKLDPQTGTITVTWEEIVNDGKGGHKEVRKQTL